jgi:hypothetical protein
VWAGKRSVASTVVDVSLSGLSVRTQLALDQGDPVEVEFHEPLRIRIRALAWNVRKARKAGEVTNVVGMMLSDVGAEYETLVERIAGGASARSAPARSPEAAAQPAATSAPPAKPAPRPTFALPSSRTPWWKLRVKEKAGSRSSILTLTAADAKEAAAKALLEMGAGWEVLEVSRKT